MIARAALIAWALLLPAAAARDDPLAGRIAGAPQECIDTTVTRNLQIVDRHTILYSQTNRRVWRTGPVDDCPDLEPSATLIVEQYGPHLCRDDRFRVHREGSVIPSAICRFSAFTPYDKPPRR